MTKKWKNGDILPVEIAGTEIGDALISEITDEHVEVVWMGRAFRLPPDVLDYFDLFSEYA